MTENPAAANPEDAASLLNVVKESQSRTRSVLRHGLPDVTMVVLAAAVADLPRSDSARSLYFGIGLVVWIAIGAANHARRLHRFGTTIARTTWLVAAFTFVATLLVNAAVEGNARRAVMAVVMPLLLGVLGVAYKHAVFFAAAVIIFLVGMGRALELPVAVLIALIVTYGVVIVVFFRKQVFGDA